MTADQRSVSVYYDGLCHLCSREIAHYRRQRGSESLRFVDITEPSFNPSADGLDPEKIHRVMHVKTSDGTVRTGVDAFIAIWKQLPKYQWAARLAGFSAVKIFLLIDYQIFAFVRPYLPRKKGSCEASPYCETRKSL